MSKLDRLPTNSERKIAKHGMKLILNLHNESLLYRNRDPSVTNQLLGHSADFKLLPELLTKEVC